jgi:hypothetical protein
MKRFAPLSSLVTVFSLFLVFAIWLTPASANTPPVFSSLGQLRVPGVMGTPGAMDLDAAGNLYVADAMGRNVLRFDPYGKLKQVYNLQVSGRGLAVTPDGKRLYVARKTSAIIVDAASGAVLGELTGSPIAAGTPEFGLTGEIDLDADGRVYVADAGAGRLKVKIYAPDGRFLTEFGGVGTAAGQFQAISALTVTSTGKVVVADPNPASLNGWVNVFTLDPVTLGVTSVVRYSKATAFGSIELHTPKGIAFDHLGRGYFLEYMFSTITVLNSSFGYLSKFNNPGYEQGQLGFVADAIYDTTNRRLFVSCDGGRIEIFATEKVCGTAGADPANCSQSPIHTNEPPTVPVPQTPVGGSVEATASPVLTFAAASDDNDTTLTYQVVVRQGETTLYSTSTTATSVTVPAGLLAENGSFTWAVQAVDSEGELSGFSSAAAFVVNAVDEPPTAPEFVEPQPATVLGGNGRFSWTISTDPDPGDAVVAYRIEIAASENFADVVATARVDANTVTLAEFTGYASLEVGRGYFGRVTALDRGQTASAPSAVLPFSYGTTVLKVDAPLRGAVVYFGGNLAYPGRPVGVTPLELRDLPAGAYDVAVETAGFETYLARVELPASGVRSVYAALKPAQQPQSFKAAKAINRKPELQVAGSATPFVIDYDADGKIDLLAGSAVGSVTIFPGVRVSSTGLMTVESGSPLSLPVIPGAVPFLVDWNNDDRKDLLVGADDGTVKLFLNIGQDALPLFAAPQDLLADGVPLTVASGAAPVVADLDNDGRKDLIVGNGAGEVFVFWNREGTDAAPKLSAAVMLFGSGAGPVAPAVVDWNADGVRDLIVASASGVTLYRNDLANSGEFVAEPLLASAARAVFPVDADGSKGRDLVLGAQDGRLFYLASSAAIYPASYPAALLGKTVELQDLMAEIQVGSALFDRLAVIRGQITEGSYAGAATQTLALAAALPAGGARQSAAELVALCGGDPAAIGSGSIDSGATPTEAVTPRERPTRTRTR